MASAALAGEASARCTLLLGALASFGARVAEIAGKDGSSTAPGAFAHTSLRTWLAANPAKTPGNPSGRRKARHSRNDSPGHR